MTNITLSNASRTVTLDFVVGYRITKVTRYPVKRVPAKLAPTVDTSAETTEPRTYDITAYVSTPTRDGILSLESDRQVIRLQDGNIDDPYTFLERPTLTHRMGNTIRPWSASLQLLSSAN